MLQGKFVPHN